MAVRRLLLVPHGSRLPGGPREAGVEDPYASFSGTPPGWCPPHARGPCAAAARVRRCSYRPHAGAREPAPRAAPGGPGGLVAGRTLQTSRTAGRTRIVRPALF